MPAIIPVLDLTTEEVLYGDRSTSYRWEVLTHNSVTGVDTLLGVLDGVKDGSLTWIQNSSVKGSGKMEIADLDVAQAGMLRVGQLSLESVRIRPVCVIDGLPEDPKGVFLVSNADESWEATGRTWNVELLDRCTVPEQEEISESYALPAGTLILQQVKTILNGIGEAITVPAGSTLATASGMVWEAGTSWLKIINDLLSVAGYNALWIDGYGNFQTTPRVLPADRSLTYEMLGIPRELVDGETKGIYSPKWKRNKDSFKIPNKVIAVQAANGADTTALTGSWTNTDPSSPYSTVSRGRTISYTLKDVECPAGTTGEIQAFLQARARAALIQMSSPQAQIQVEHLPIPIRVSDATRFAHEGASIDTRYIFTKIQLDCTPLGRMKSTLQEVISL